ncbi:conserved hypothetical protein [Theileria orientalis strain Shintoku]|uniref:Uncharacterized protein n=1 Tax=Theileria orientalis strain Shintoku TaxID=869250 RepID=J4C8D6_THEOR|nr:conserved hypothetical protein [Theileria orientalis strain Shintoku]BAM40603.1 conserved hypothetical protein [Theileria orientalis strain Shintoku]|eukprot:XP_009690904.1 conserved hypothetical protein [Theileria orientalis strain Shintoku]
MVKAELSLAQESIGENLVESTDSIDLQQSISADQASLPNPNEPVSITVSTDVHHTPTVPTSVVVADETHVASITPDSVSKEIGDSVEGTHSGVQPMTASAPPMGQIATSPIVASAAPVTSGMVPGASAAGAPVAGAHLGAQVGSVAMGAPLAGAAAVPGGLVHGPPVAAPVAHAGGQVGTVPMGASLAAPMAHGTPVAGASMVHAAPGAQVAPGTHVAPGTMTGPPVVAAHFADQNTASAGAPMTAGLGAASIPAPVVTPINMASPVAGTHLGAQVAGTPVAGAPLAGAPVAGAPVAGAPVVPGASVAAPAGQPAAVNQQDSGHQSEGAGRSTFGDKPLDKAKSIVTSVKSKSGQNV